LPTLLSPSSEGEDDVVSLSSRPELNGKAFVVDEHILDSNQNKVTLEAKSKEVLLLPRSHATEQRIKNRNQL